MKTIPLIVIAAVVSAVLLTATSSTTGLLDAADEPPPIGAQAVPDHDIRTQSYYQAEDRRKVQQKEAADAIYSNANRSSAQTFQAASVTACGAVLPDVFEIMPIEFTLPPIDIATGELIGRDDERYQNYVGTAMGWLMLHKGPFCGQTNVWNVIQQHESPWGEDGPRCEGGLGFCGGSYRENKWPQMPDNAGWATPEEQMIVAEIIFRDVAGGHYCREPGEDCAWSSAPALGLGG